MRTAYRVRAVPQLEVLGAVVVLDAVAVVDSLSATKRSAKLALHSQAVLEDDCRAACARYPTSPDGVPSPEQPARPAGRCTFRPTTELTATSFDARISTNRGDGRRRASKAACGFCD